MIHPLSQYFVTPEEYREETHGPSIRGHLTLMPCRSGMNLAVSICDAYNRFLTGKQSQKSIKLSLATIDTFPDTEIQVRDISDTMRGLDIYVIQQLYDPLSDRSVNDNLMELLILTDALKRHSARNITAVLPYPPYMRQDKIDFKKRQPISSKLIANLLHEAGITQLVTGTLHVEQIKGFYDIPIDEIDMIKTWVSCFEEFKGRDDVIVIAPDSGAVPHNKILANYLGLKLAVGQKARKTARDVAVENIAGNFEGKTTGIIVDDIISTAGSLWALGNKLKEVSSIEKLYIAATHGLLTDQAKERLIYLHEKRGLQKLYITNSVPQRQEFLQQIPFVEVIPLEEDLALRINRIHYEESLRAAFVDNITPIGKDDD